MRPDLRNWTELCQNCGMRSELYQLWQIIVDVGIKTHLDGHRIGGGGTFGPKGSLVCIRRKEEKMEGGGSGGKKTRIPRRSEAVL